MYDDVILVRDIIGGEVYHQGLILFLLLMLLGTFALPLLRPAAGV